MASGDSVVDAEKGVVKIPGPEVPPESRASVKKHDPTLNVHDEITPQNKFLAWLYRIEILLGFEARGIHRVKEQDQTEKTTLNFWQIVMMWFSINAAAQNITLGSIGQSVFELGFVDAICCSVFGGILGTIPVAYTAGWGPWSGNRTLVCSYSSNN
jgi:hypothetical protein